MPTPPLSAADLFACIADGSRILGAYQTMVQANQMSLMAASNDEARHQRSAMLNHPDLQQYLPGLGYQPSGQPEIRSWIARDYNLGAFMEHARTLARTTVAVPAAADAPWATVTQTIAAADLLAAITAFDLDPQVYDLPTVAAFAVARNFTTSVEFPWGIDDTGIRRSLPPWPLRTPVDREPQRMIMSDSKQTPVPCHAWVVDLPLRERADEGGAMIFLSLAGSAALLKMAKANLTPRSNRTAVQSLPLDGAKRMPGRVNPNRTWFATPIAGAYHAVMLDRRILQPELPHLYHVTGADGVPDWTLLFDQLNRVLLIPVEYSMIEPLWHAALAADDDLIVPLHSYGCQGYRVHVDRFHAWAHLIGTITKTPTTVTIVGHPTPPAADDATDVAVTV